VYTFTWIDQSVFRQWFSVLVSSFVLKKPFTKDNTSNEIRTRGVLITRWRTTRLELATCNAWDSACLFRLDKRLDEAKNNCSVLNPC
jgi:hypothetical protein